MIVRKALGLMIGAALAAWTAAAGAPAAWAEPVKIAVAHMPHMTGAYAAGQVGVNEGFLDAVWFVNEKHLIPGVELVAQWADGGTDVAKAMNAYKSLIADTPAPVAMIGESTAVALALKKWNMRDEVPNIEGGSDDEMYNLPSWTFSAGCPYVNQFGAWVDYYLKELWPKKGQNRAPRFAFLTWDNPFGRAPITDNTKAYLKKRGVELVAEEFIAPVPTDTTPQLLRLKEKGVDFTFGGMYHTAFNVVLKDAGKLGMTDSIDMGLSFAVNMTEVIAGAGDLARNVYVTQFFRPPDTWAKDAPEALRVFRARNRDEKFATIWSQGFQRGMIAAQAVKLAVEKVGARNVKGADLYDALQRMNEGQTYTSLPITYTAKKRYGLDDMFIIRLNNKKMNILGTFRGPNLTKYDWN